MKMTFLSCKIFSFALVLLLVNLLQTTDGQQITIGKKRYRAFTTEKVNWYRAFQTCAAWGMRLASIENESDLTELKNSLFSQSILANNYWLAGNNLANSGEYIWLSSGNKFSYTKWVPSQPGTSSNRCVRTNFNFEWVADVCTNKNYFICSKPVDVDCGVYGQCAKGVTYLYDF